MDQATKEMMGLIMGLIAMVMGMGIPILAIYLEYRKRKEMFTMQHQERMAAIEKGIELTPLPETFFTADGQPARPHSPYRNLKFSLFLLSVGLAFLIALYFNGRGAAALYALIPIFWGLAGLIYHFTLGKKEAEAIEAEQKAKAAEAGRSSQP